MDITFVLCPNIIGLLGLLLLLVFARFNYYIEKKKLKLFVLAALCNIFIIAMEVGDYLLAESTFEMAYIMRRHTSAICFALTPIVPMLIAYIATKKKLSRWLLLPAGINIVISISSIYTGHLFYIDKFNSYYRGKLFYALVIVSSFYLLLLIFVSLRNLNSIVLGEAVFLFGIVVVMIVANILEIAFAFHFVIWNCSGVLLISYYLFLHIQYFKTDPMTGVFNRNMYDFEVEKISHKTNIGVVSFDLNGLKKINDTLGHEKGDEFIVSSAELIVKAFHNVGHIFRVGGDEFIVLLTNTKENIIKEKIADFEQLCEKSDVSIACGFSFMEKPSDISQMLRDADDAMYENKRIRNINVRTDK